MSLPPLAEILQTARVVDLPLVAAFRGQTKRQAVLFEGPSGWAEFAPFADHAVEHAARWLSAAIEQSYGTWPAAVRQAVEVNAILPEISVAATADWVHRLHTENGFTTFKFKSATDFEIDLQRIALINQTATELEFIPKIRLDVNGRWDLPTAVKNFEQLENSVANVEYVEQPILNILEYPKLKSASNLPVALDESLRLADSPDMQFISELADVLVVKAIPLGGVKAASELLKDFTKPVVVSGSLDTSVGLAAGIQLAASLKNSLAAGLGTDKLFAASVTRNPHRILDGKIEVKRVEPDLADNWLATERIKEEWLTRLRICYEYLEQK